MILRGLKLQEAIQLAAEGDARGKSVRSCGMSGMRRCIRAKSESLIEREFSVPGLLPRMRKLHFN